METISIWLERSGGQDPTSHFWFESGGIPLRICDGETRLAGADRSPEVYAPCRSCKDLYLEDVLYGRKVFAILTEPPESHRHPSLNGVYPKFLGEYTPFKEGCMVRISVGLFAKFYEVRPAGQVHIVRDLRMRLANPKGYMLRDFYGSLRSTLRGTHWTTGGITTFENALPASVDSQKQEQRKEHYPARDFELGLSGQVAAFLQIWNQLDEQAQRAEKDGGP